MLEGRDATVAAELLDGGYAEGAVARGCDGTVSRVAFTRLTFDGRSALDESSVWFRVERVMDFALGVFTGAAAGVVAKALEVALRALLAAAKALLLKAFQS